MYNTSNFPNPANRGANRMENSFYVGSEKTWIFFVVKKIGFSLLFKISRN